MYQREMMIISVYPEMTEDVKAVCAALKISPIVLEWEIAQDALIDHLKHRFLTFPKPDVIISRGATAGLIEQYLPEIVTIRAEPDDLDLLEVITDASAYGSNVGLLLFEDLCSHFNLATARKLLGMEKLRLYPFRTRADIESQVLQGKKDGMDVMVGGGKLAGRVGAACGMRVVFAQSGRTALEKAIHQAQSIIFARQKERLQYKCFRAAVASMAEGILSVENGVIMVANRQIGKIFRINEGALIGRDITQVSEDMIPGHVLSYLLREPEEEKILKIHRQNVFVQKSFVKEQTCDRLIAVFQLTREIQEQEQRVRTGLRDNGFVTKYTFDSIVAESAPMRQLLQKAKTYAATEANVLIGGASGTGKELLAQGIHNASSRAGESFVAVNCAAIPANLLESELFGYEEGAFSGAKRGGKQGLFELAHRGTIFLDEIDSMPLELQGVLLRTLQEREVRRVGSVHNIYVDIRIIAACNKNLAELVQDGRFRADLYYRLNTLQLILPRLDDRKEDICPLAVYFLNDYCARYRCSPMELSEENRRLLEARNWPGNIRELRNVIHRLVVLHQHGVDSVAVCFDEERPAPALSKMQGITAGEKRTLAAIERDAILSCLRANGGNRTKTAKDLGISRSTLWKKLEVLGL